jgi:hypothetical protein
MNDYNKQAQDFLEKTGTKFKAAFLGNMKYFDDDTEKRDVYEITLERTGKKWSFQFGQYIANSGDKVKRNPKGETLYDHELLNRKRIAPTPYDVLAAITKYDPEDFENFCANYGYDTDSRKAEKTYFAVQKEYKHVVNMFNDVMDDLAEIN